MSVSLNTFNITSLTTIDKRGGLYKTGIPFDENVDGAPEALVYSATKLSNNKPAPDAVFLKSSAVGDNYFSIEDRAQKTLTMVAAGDGSSYKLYVYTNKTAESEAGFVQRFTFGEDGVLTNEKEFTNPLDIATEEISANRDLDNNKALGGKLQDKSGILDKLGNLYKVNVAEQDVFIVTDADTPAVKTSTTSINLEEFALKVDDGNGHQAIWTPDPTENYSSFAALQSFEADGQTAAGWDIFAVKKDDTGVTSSITKFSFGLDRVLLEDSGTEMSAKEVAALEKSRGKDLDNNKLFGIASSEVIDSTGGLFKASLLGTEFYVVNTDTAGLKTSKASANGVDFSGALLDETGAGWAPPSGDITSIVTDEENDKAQIYVTDSTDSNVVTRYDFTKVGGNYTLDQDFIDGVTLDAISLAAAESSNTRDLNKDSEFGITITPSSVLDKKGGLNKVTAIGQDFLITGTNIVTNSKKVTDLTNALTVDGVAWKPEDANGNPISLDASNIKVIVSNDQLNAEVYVKSEGVFTKYSFDRTVTTKTWSLSEDAPTVLDDIELAALETSTGRDISGEGLLGAYVDTRIDKAPGLYTAHFRSIGSDATLATPENIESKVYLYSADKITPGGLITNRVDFSKALMDEGGTSFWTPKDGYDVTGAYMDADAKEYKVFVTLRTGTGPTDFDSNKFRCYTFDLSEGNTQYQIKDPDYSISAPELVTFENLLKRDLNMDGIKGVVVYKNNTETDKVGGLFKVDGPDGDYFVSKPFSSTGRITDLTNAFYLDDDKAEAWAPSSSTTDDAEYSTTKLTLKQYDDNSFSIYQQEKRTDADSPNIYTKYTFDENHVLTSTEHLDLIQLANEESELGNPRDINGDGFFGAKVEAVMDRTSPSSFLAKVSIEGKYMLSATSTAPQGRVTNLKNVLMTDDSKPIFIDEQGQLLDENNDPTGYFAKSVIRRTEGDNAIIELFATKLNDNSTSSNLTDDFNDVKLMRFEQTNKPVNDDDTEGDFYFRMTDTKVLSSSELIELETREVTGRDLNGDKVVGVKISANIDKVSGLYSASVLGEKYYFHAAANTRSSTNLANSVDLSTAFYDDEGSPWAKPDDETISGMVVNRNGDGREIGYDIYTYKRNRDDQHLGELAPGLQQYEVTKHSWSYSEADGLVFEGSKSVDTAALVAVETNASVKKDLSGDGFVGFNIQSTQARYNGVTEAKVLGGSDGRFFIVTPKNPRVGTPAAPWRAQDALLNEDGDGAWSIPSLSGDMAGYVGVITAVREPSATDRFVYVTYKKNDEEDLVYKYKFSKSNGKFSGESEALNSVNLASEEFASNLDLNADDQKGIARYTDIKAGATFVLGRPAGGTKSMGLMLAEVNNTKFLVAKNIPATTKKMNLDMALLDEQGNAWKPDDGFTIKGIYKNGDNTEIYGSVPDGDGQQFRKYVFHQENYAQSDDALETYEIPAVVLKLVPKDDSNLFTSMTNSDIAVREIDATKDLNNDNRIGFIVKNEASDLKVSTLSNSGTTIGKAAVSDDPLEIYVALKGPSGRRDFGNLGVMTQSAFNAAKTANQNALRDGDDFWKPDDGFEVLSIIEDGDNIKVFAGLKPSGPLPDDLPDDFDKNTLYEYTFSQGDTGWDLEGTKATLDTEKVINREVGLAKPKDLNNDGHFGLTFDEKGSTSGLIKAHIGEDDARKDYIFVGHNISKVESLGLSSSKAFGLNNNSLSLLKATVGATTPWKPEDGLTPTNFSSVIASTLPTNILAADVSYVMTLEDASHAETKLYFTSSYEQYAPYPLLDDGAASIQSSYEVTEDLDGYIQIPYNFAKVAEGASDPIISIKYGELGNEEAPNWIKFDTSENSIKVSAGNSMVGPHILTVRASDADGRFVSKSFTLNVQNADDKPVKLVDVDAKIGDTAIDHTGVYVTNGRNFPLIDVSGVFETVDAGDTLAYSVAVKDENGDDAAKPSWLVIDPATGIFAANPVDGLTANLTIVVTATATPNTIDGLSLTESYEFTIKPNNAPAASTDATQFSPTAMATVGNAFSYDLTGLFTDEDADDVSALVLSAKLPNGNELPSGGWTIEDKTLKHKSPVPANMPSTLNMTITATDTHGVSTDFELAISKNIMPFKLSSIAPQTFSTGTAWSFTLPSGLFKDDDSDTLTFDVVVSSDDSALPTGLSFDKDTKTLSYDGTSSDIEALEGTDLTLKVKAYDHYDADRATAPANLSFGFTNLKLTIKAPVV